MSDEYLWDRSGEFDSEVANLETVLAGYRYAPRRKRRATIAWAVLAIAASVALAITAVAFRSARKPVSAWQMAGEPTRIGQIIETGGAAGTTLVAESFGQIALEPHSRLQVLPAARGNQRVALRRGTMHALIWAPPSSFVVDTPSAKTIDLGCSYTLTVFPDDSGMLSVQAGWVAFQNGPMESFIPAGAVCRTRRHLGPGIPFFEDARREFAEGIRVFDTSAGRKGLDTILANARPQDALSLWHLVLRTSGADRDAVVARFSTLVPGLDGDGLRAGDSRAVDRAWDSLGLGGADLWRMWKRSWRAGS